MSEEKSELDEIEERHINEISIYDEFAVTRYLSEILSVQIFIARKLERVERLVDRIDNGVGASQ